MAKVPPDAVLTAMQDGWLLAQSTKHNDGYLLQFTTAGRRLYRNDIGTISEQTINRLLKKKQIRETDHIKQIQRIFFILNK